MSRQSFSFAVLLLSALGAVRCADSRPSTPFSLSVVDRSILRTTRVTILLLPPTGDPATVTPIAARATDIGPVGDQYCNKEPPPPAWSGDGFPTAAEFDDPFRPGTMKTCRVPLPPIPRGARYRIAAVFSLPACQDSTADAASPRCVSERSPATPLFTIPK